MNGSLLYNYILVNRFFRRKVSIISSLNRRTVKLLGLNLHPLLISTNCLVLTDTIDEVLSAISIVLHFIAHGYHCIIYLYKDRLYTKVVYT